MKNTRPIIVLLILFGSLLLAAIPIALASAAAVSQRPAVTCNVPAERPTIAAALADPTCDPITVAPGTFVENLVVTRNVTIDGATTAATIVDGGGTGVVFDISSGLVVTLSHLTVTHGSGGGIVNGPGSTLTLNDLAVIDNSSSVAGGIWSDIGSALTLNDSLVASNTASINGGGIASIGTVTLNDTVVAHNTAGANGGGISYGTTAPATMTVNNSTFMGNHAPYGGALFNGQMNTVIVNNSVIISNSGNFGGGIFNDISGTLSLTGGTIQENRAFNWGGGIANHGPMTVTGSMVLSNTANGSGGGIYNAAGDLTLGNSTLEANMAGDRGGGLINIDGVMAVSRSTLNGNTAAFGAGYFHLAFFADAPSRLQNSTLSANSAITTGGGIFVQNGTLLVINTTVYANSAITGGGVFRNDASLFPKYLTATNTIIAGSQGGDCAGQVGSADYNLSGDATCTGFSAPNDITGTNPGLGPLQNNGGDTETHASLPGSPVRDAGSCILPIDQRGIPRPQGVECDIGAHENEYLYVIFFPAIFSD